MAFIQSTFAKLIVAAVLCGCVSQRQAAIDDAYHRGDLSYADRNRLTRDLIQQQLAASDAYRRQQEQQPAQNKNTDKVVYPQPEEDLRPIAN